MGGFQQVTQLIKKNLVVKTRRPKSYCFELSLPIVLFLLLVYVRQGYDFSEEPVGPTFFGTDVIFPLSGSLLGSTNAICEGANFLDENRERLKLGSSVSDSLEVEGTVEIEGWGNFSLRTACDSIDLSGPTSEELWRIARETLICSKDAQEWLTDRTEQLLSWAPEDGKTLGGRLQEVDAAALGGDVRDAVLEIQEFNATEVLDAINDLRVEYLNSTFRHDLEEAAEAVDKELSRLREALDTADGEVNRSALESLLTEWVDGACNLNLSIFDSLNETTLAEALARFSTVADDVREWIDDQLLNTLLDRFDLTRDDVDSFFEDLLNISDVSDQIRDLLTDNLLTPLDRFLNSTSLSGTLSGRLSSSVDIDGIVNFTALANTFERFVDRVGDFVESNTTEELVDELVELANELRDFILELDPDDVAADLDNYVLWISHYVQPDGPTMTFLEMDFGYDGLSSPNFNSNAARVFYEALVDLQGYLRNVSNTSIFAENYSFSWDFDSDARGFQQTLEELVENLTVSSNVTLELRDVLEVAIDAARDIGEWIEEFWGNVSGRNASYIENELFPEWREEWSDTCSRLNVTRLTDLILDLEDACPWCWERLRNLTNNMTFTNLVNDFHKELEAWDPRAPEDGLTESLADALHAAEDLLQELDAEHLGNATQEFVEMAQVSWNVSLGQDLERVMAENLTNRLWEELLERFGDNVTCDANPGSGGGSGSRRLQGGFNEYLTEFLNGKVVLVAPFKGEARELWEYMLVEAILSVTDVEQGMISDPLIEAVIGNPVVRGVATAFIDDFLQERLKTFDTEEELIKYAEDNSEDVLLAIVFRSASSSTGNFPEGALDVKYAIRMHAEFLPSTSNIVAWARDQMFGGSVFDSRYITLMFVHLQDFISRGVARLRAHRELDFSAEHAGSSQERRNAEAHNRTELMRQLSVGATLYPTPRIEVDRFIYVIQYTLPLLMVLGWIYATALLVREMVYEKQERLREVMRIMGLKTWVYWLSWAVSAMGQMTFFVTIMTALMVGGDVLPKSNWLCVFIFWWLYSGAIVSLAMLISSFFTRAKVAAVCGAVFYWILYMPYSLYNRYDDTTPLVGKCLYCLMAPTGIGIGMNIVAKLELSSNGLQWDSVWTPPELTNTGALPKTDFSLGHVWMMFIVDIFVYQWIAWYIEKVSPGPLGLPQPFYFLLLPSYWCGDRGGAKADTSITQGAEAENKDNLKLESWEAAPENLNALVQIRRLTKTFHGGKQALRGISLDMYQGTILGLLGHNGAGKSTTMSILTGLYPPTSGDVFVGGKSVSKDSNEVRKQLGVCLQHNALYDVLTVEEHLNLFCHLKCVPRKEVGARVTGLIKDIGLEAKRHAASASLSGGMKRRLSIGIALAGDSQVIALDEPTAGVDATSRREIWQILASQKERRTFLLSTHFMDEADVLSDRIAIIAEGQLVAIGSSLALKKRFADGYMLTVVTKDAAHPRKILEAIRAVVPQAEAVGSRGREISFALPASSRMQFAELFTAFEDEKVRREVGIDSYGLSAGTMEEVFLNASSMHEAGLHGVVRNLDKAGSDEASTAEHSSVGSLSGTREGTPDTQMRPGKSGSMGSQDLPDDSLNSPASDTPPQVNTPPPGQVNVQSAEPAPPMSPVSVKAPHGEMIDDEPRVLEGALANGATKAKPGPKGSTEKNPAAVGAVTNQGVTLWTQQFRARLWMRAKSVSRDRRAWASQLLLPAVFVFIAMVFAYLVQVDEEEKALKLSTEMFEQAIDGGRHTVPFHEGRGDALGASIVAAFKEAKSPTDDLLYVDLDGTTGGFQQYLLNTTQDFRRTSFGAFSLHGDSDPVDVNLWHRGTAIHGVPAMMNMYSNARLQLLGYTDTITQVWSHPLPLTQALLEDALSGRGQVFNDLIVAITIILAMGFVPASFVLHLVQERSSNGKHQQLLTGVSPAMYWTTNYCWDVINFLFPALVCFSFFLIFGVAAYSGANSPGVLVLLLVYGICMTPCMYCFENLFSIPSSGYVIMICLNIFTGSTSVLAVTVMQLYEQEVPDIKPVNNFFKAVFPIFLPNYCLGRGLIEIATNHYINYIAEEFGVCIIGNGGEGGLVEGCNRSPLHWDVAGRFIFWLCIMAPIWFGFRLLVEWRFFVPVLFRRKTGKNAGVSNDSLDKDVQLEAERVMREQGNTKPNHHPRGFLTNGDALILRNLVKTFRVSGSACSNRTRLVRSVRGVSVGVSPGECFGLLGVNGAGKTTTMRMITGDIEPSAGEVLVSGWSTDTARDKARKNLGYCPQFDALPDLLTTRETLTFYARIRGVLAENVPAVVDAMIKRMCLEAHQDRKTHQLSGGNKRKLSTALALIGEPQVVLLDEPSTGVDVGARRFLWDFLGNLRQQGHALVLTSHSMDECEVLCTRLTIMVHGSFACLGSPIQLKEKYGGGYTLTVKAQPQKQALLGAAGTNPALVGDTTPVARLLAFFSEKLPSARLSEQNVGLLRYRLGGVGSTEGMETSLADVFRAIETAANEEEGSLQGAISDYTVSQTSLEEVFLHFSMVAEDKKPLLRNHSDALDVLHRWW